MQQKEAQLHSLKALDISTFKQHTAKGREDGWQTMYNSLKPLRDTSTNLPKRKQQVRERETNREATNLTH